MKKLALLLTQWSLCFVVGFALSVSVTAAFAYVVPNWKRPAATLQWDYAPDAAAAVASFKIYYGVEPRAYTNTVSVSSTLRAVIITNLANATTYYFTATAVDMWGAESEYSNEVTNTTPLKMNPPGQLRATIVNTQ